MMMMMMMMMTGLPEKNIFCTSFFMSYRMSIMMHLPMFYLSNKDKVWVFTLFVCHGQPINDAGDVVALLQQEISSVFVGRFRSGLHRLFGEEKAFQWTE